MLTQERYEMILSILSERDAVTVAELSAELQTSESTIRRDLNNLAEAGKLNKVFGGATSIKVDPGVEDIPFESRESAMSDEKTAIGRYAATLIRDGDLVFIDAGTTTYRLIDFLTNKKATYVTNGVAHSRKLVQGGFNTFIISGRVKPVTEAVVGSTGIELLSKFNFTKAFMGTNGIDARAGFSTPELDEGQLKEAVFKNSYMTFVLSDHSKFRKIYPVTFAKLKTACIITDYVPYERFKEYTIIKEVMT